MINLRDALVSQASVFGHTIWGHDLGKVLSQKLGGN